MPLQSHAHPPASDGEEHLLAGSVKRLAADTGSAGGALTPGQVRLRALRSLAKGVGLVLLGG
ncbi:hypothetical protein HMI51_19770, partial [Corallococcus coralloides]|nr:hypothetical protein [Corallococcus coralloides]